MTKAEAIEQFNFHRIDATYQISDAALDLAIYSLKTNEAYCKVIEDIEAAIQQSACDQKIKLVAVGMEKALEIIEKHTEGKDD